MGAIAETVTELNPSIALPVKLAGDEYFLPWKYVGDGEEGDYIAYFDPRQRPELCEAGAIELARMAAVFRPTLIVTIESSKSGPMVQRARDLLQESNGGGQVDIVTFAKMRLEDIDKPENSGAIGYYAQYSPIPTFALEVHHLKDHSIQNF